MTPCWWVRDTWGNVSLKGPSNRHLDCSSGQRECCVPDLHWAQGLQKSPRPQQTLPSGSQYFIFKNPKSHKSSVIFFIRCLLAFSKASYTLDDGSSTSFWSQERMFSHAFFSWFFLFCWEVFLEICLPKGRERSERIPSEACFLFPVVEQKCTWRLLTRSCLCLCFIPRKPVGSVRDSGRSTTASPVRSWLKKMTSSTEHLCE